MTQGKGSKLSRGGIFTLMFAATFTVMVGSLITPALPAIAKGLNFVAGAGWLVTIPSLGVVLFGPIAGRIIDRWGGRNAMICGLVAYGLFGEAVVFFGFSRILVVADRLLLGAATAMVMAAGTTLIADCFEGAERLKMIAWQGMAIEIGGVLFLALGGLLGEMGWRVPFLLYLLAWVCLIFLFLFLPKGITDRKQQDVEESGGADANSLMYVYVSAFMAMTVFFVAYITLPDLLKLRFSLSEANTGYFMALISLVAVLCAAGLPALVRVVQPKLLLAVASLLFGLGHVVLARSISMTGMLVGAIVMGAGFACAIPIANHLVVDESPAKDRGKNLSYLSVAIFLGQFASSFVTLASGSASRAMQMAGAGSILFGLYSMTRAMLARKVYETRCS